MRFCICAVHQLEEKVFRGTLKLQIWIWNSTQTAEFLKVFLSLSHNM